MTRSRYTDPESRPRLARPNLPAIRLSRVYLRDSSVQGISGPRLLVLYGVGCILWGLGGLVFSLAFGR